MSNNYNRIWQKVLSEDEKVIHEFSIGNLYRKIWVILGAIISVPLLFLGGFGIVTFLGFLFYGWYLKAANAYAFTNKRVVIHKGWLSTKVRSIDYDKITDVTVEEPFFQRMIDKTGSLVINTAGTGAYEIVLSAVERPYELKKELDRIRAGKS